MNFANQKSLVAVLLVVVTAVATILAAKQKGEGRRASAFWLAWLLPGLGHVMMGQAKKALFFFGVLVALQLFGLWICGWRTVSFDDNPFYYVGQFGSGMALLLGQTLGGEKAYPREGLPVSWYDPGLLYVCVAGLLNLVVMMSVFAPAAAPSKPPASAPAATPEAKPA
jgi:hypothetical protein